MKKLTFGHKGWLAINVLQSAIGASLSGISIYLLRFITDYGLNRQLDDMLRVAQWMAIIIFVRLFISLISTYLRSAYIEKSLLLMKTTYIHGLLKQDITQLQKEKTNTYRSNLTNDFDNYERKFLINTLEMIDMVLSFTMAVILIATISLPLVLVAFGLLIVFVILTNFTSKPVQKTEAKKSKSLSEYTDYIQETLNGFEIIKQHQLQVSRFKRFVQMATNVQKDNYKVDVKTTQVEAINQFVQTLVLFSIVVFGILFAKANDVSLGSIIVVASSFGNVMWPLQRFSPVITEMKGIVKILDNFDNNLQRPVIDRHVSLSTFDQLAFNQTNLGYIEDDFDILTNVNLTIDKGQKILIVGPSGAGKSTILKTIRQSIQPKKGVVSVNNHNIYDIIPIDYYSLFSTVDQIGFIFNGSILENITLYQPMDNQKVINALHRVGLSDFELDMQLVNNGSNISGGQRARLMLARALVLNSDVILCDEIFASLDLSIASSIEKDMLSLDKTIINVSHIVFKDHLKHYDKIYIVDDATLILTDNHQQVLDRMSLSNQGSTEIQIA